MNQGALDHLSNSESVPRSHGIYSAYLATSGDVHNDRIR